MWFQLLQREALANETLYPRTCFFFCVEGPSNFLDITAEEGIIHGCHISPNAPEITHLLFADDNFLFFKASQEEATHEKGILNAYADISGQVVNYMKLGVFFSSNVR